MSNRIVWMSTALASVVLMAAAAVTHESEAPRKQATRDERLTLFVSPNAVPEARAIEEILTATRRSAAIQIEFVLLIKDYQRLAPEPGSELAVAVEAIRKAQGESFVGLALYDPEALAKAKRLGIARLPALVLERRGQFHIAYGRNLDVEELLACSK